MELNHETPLAFQDRQVPKETRLGGWAALVHSLGVAALVQAASAVAGGYIKGGQRKKDGWIVFDKRYWPDKDVADHISFSVRHEWFNPLVPKRVFDALGLDKVSAIVRDAPTGTVARHV